MWCVSRACGVCVITYGGTGDADAVAKQLVLRGVEPLICVRGRLHWMRSGLEQMMGVEGVYVQRK